MKYLLFITMIFMCDACDHKGEPLTTRVLLGVKSDDVTLDVPSSDVKADGKDSKLVTLKVTGSGSDILNRNVTFSISPIGVFKNGQTTYTIRLANQDNATVSANVFSTKEGKANITVKIDNVEMQGSINFEKISMLNNLSFGTQATTTLADNYSTAELILTAKPESGITQERKVTFVTDKGTFEETGTKEYLTDLDATSNAKAHLKHNKAENVKVTAKIANTYDANTDVKFDAASPEFIEEFVHDKTIKPSLESKIMIIAKLKRTKGMVSEGQKVIFKDEFGNGGPSVGSFLSSTLSKGSGEVSAIYQLTNTNLTDLPKLLYIKVYDDSGKNKLGETTIIIQ